MADKVYKKIRVVGCSTKNYEAAIRLALKKAAESLHGLSWWEVLEQRGACSADGEATEWQVTLEVGFRLD